MTNAPWVAKAFRLAAWLVALLIVFLSIVPLSARPTTEVPHGFEHFGIFFINGLAFGAGYPRHPLLTTLLLAIFSAAIELTQYWVPGRHARLSDFAIDTFALWLGAGLIFAIRRVYGRTAR